MREFIMCIMLGALASTLIMQYIELMLVTFNGPDESEDER